LHFPVYYDWIWFWWGLGWHLLGPAGHLLENAFHHQWCPQRCFGRAQWMLILWWK
jgi:hypothetical protein